MSEMKSDQLRQLAIEILKENDRGSYTVPTKGLYPFQWNWDSCFTALGQASFDEDRAWTEIETLFAHQWTTAWCRTSSSMRTMTAISRAPASGIPAARCRPRASPSPSSPASRCASSTSAAPTARRAERRARALLPKVDRWAAWFYANRDPQREGLVAILHPWEAGRDNSIDWDEAFDRVPTEGIAPYTRRDTQHADPAHRPTKAQYDRYIWLVEHFRKLGWDNARLHDASPFQIVDPGFNAILIRGCQDLAALAGALGAADIAEANAARAETGLAAMERLWSEEHGQYLCLDRVSGRLVDSASIGGLIPVFAAIPEARAAAIGQVIARQAEALTYIVASHDPADERFDAKRYWRGPVWLVVNYMLVDGLRAAGEVAIADRIVRSSLELIETSGFAEYYDPTTGEPCGGGRFTWTAAMVLEFLAMDEG